MDRGNISMQSIDRWDGAGRIAHVSAGYIGKRQTCRAFRLRQLRAHQRARQRVQAIAHRAAYRQAAAHNHSYASRLSIAFLVSGARSAAHTLACSFGESRVRNRAMRQRRAI